MRCALTRSDFFCPSFCAALGRRDHPARARNPVTKRAGEQVVAPLSSPRTCGSLCVSFPLILPLLGVRTKRLLFELLLRVVFLRRRPRFVKHPCGKPIPHPTNFNPPRFFLLDVFFIGAPPRACRPTATQGDLRTAPCRRRAACHSGFPEFSCNGTRGDFH